MTYLDMSGEALARETVANPDEPIGLAQLAYDAARDGSRRYREAVALAMRALAGVSAASLDDVGARAFALVCVALCCCDAYSALDAALGVAIDSARASGSAGSLTRAYFDRAHSRLRQGRLVEALGDLDRLAALAHHHGPIGAVRAAGLRALCQLERDGPEAAAATLALALAPMGEDRTADPRCCLWLLAHARTTAAAGNLEGATDDLAEVGQRQLRLGAPNPAHLWWRSEASGIALRRGRQEQALAFASEELELARVFGSPRALGIALRSTGAVRGGAGGRELLTESVAVLRGSGAQLELARALVELGALVRRGGERREARTVLGEGGDLAERLGATALGARAREELAAAGARPRRTRLSGADALTASERRIAELAAAGSSNREIAATLFVTIRTVTTHLTHVYQKLEVAGRGDLALALTLGGEDTDPADDAGGVIGGVADLAPVGPALDGGLAARAASLTGAPLALARSVAVLGPTRAARVAGALSGLDAPTVTQAWRELASAGILQEGKPWFAARGLEATVYGAIPAYERAHAHRDAARLLAKQRADLEEIADHLLQAEPAGDDEVIALLDAAARHACGRGAPARAVKYLRRAMAEPPAETDLPAVVGALGAAEAATGDPASEADLEHALRLAPDAGTRARTAAQLAGMLYWAGRFADCHALAGRAIAELGTDADPELVSCLESIRVSVELIDTRFAGRLSERVPYLRMLAVAAETGGQSLLILDGFRRWQHRLPGETPRALVDRGIAAGYVAALEGVSGPATAFSVAMFVLADEDDRASRLLETILASARQSGHVGAEVVALGWRSHLALRTGRAAAALRDAEVAVELVEGRAFGAIAPVVRCSYADALAERGRLADAASAIEAVPLRGLDDTAYGARTLLVRGRLRLAQGHRTEAAEDLRACGAASRGLFTDNPEACPWRSTLALALAPDDPEQALELVREELALARRRRHARAVATALRAHGLVEGGETGIELLREAVAAFASTTARLEHARALTDLGVALSHAGRHDAARQSLREGLGLAVRAGATVIADRAVRELVATGTTSKRS